MDVLPMRLEIPPVHRSDGDRNWIRCDDRNGRQSNRLLDIFWAVRDTNHHGGVHQSRWLKLPTKLDHFLGYGLPISSAQNV